MPLIKQKQLVNDDSWTFVADGTDLPASGDVVVSLARAMDLIQRNGRLGVRVEPEDDVNEVAKVLSKVSLIAINFPKFGDGRGYSKARLLRERFAYKGELRAVGEVLADQLQYMLRCGFDSFALAEGKDVAAAIRAMQDFTITYQAATDDPRPLYRRVARGEKSV
jgi:uncharacterized protein (DUF934 family)